ncbi:Rv2175c family DNA-binding protein [Spiractinospora alimapuensis]|uniref:Rv2175c family DNA-binding protein n=1 Tax=Spiractinospora alimapuensis TaxID=2820884 RepID=UPI001EEF3719|nr:Rv2175c family DNA-binding protein [Spiractinospora alimapuensis]
MTQIDHDTETLIGEWLTLNDAAKALSTSPNRVKQLVRDNKLTGIRQGGTITIPAAFIVDGEVLKGLAGTLTVLADAGFTESEALRWLFTADDTLPGTPIEALTKDRGTEIRRRAQALAI